MIHVGPKSSDQCPYETEEERTYREEEPRDHGGGGGRDVSRCPGTLEPQEVEEQEGAPRLP